VREQLTHSATEAIQDGSSAQRQSMPLITLCREVTACSSRNSPQTASREVPLRSIAKCHWIFFLGLLKNALLARGQEPRCVLGASSHLSCLRDTANAIRNDNNCVKCRSERYCPLVCNVAVNFER